MNQEKEIYEMAYDGSRAVFIDRQEQVYGGQEYIDNLLGHIIFDEFDIKKIKGYQAQEFIFCNRSSEYHIYVDNKDVDMINTLINYQKKSKRLKIKTSKDIQKKLKRGYVLAGIATTIVMSGIAYAAGSGMIEDTIDNVQTHMEEVQENKERRRLEVEANPIYLKLLKERELRDRDGSLVSTNYNFNDDVLRDISIDLLETFDACLIEMDRVSSGGMLNETGARLVDQFMKTDTVIYEVKPETDELEKKYEDRSEISGPIMKGFADSKYGVTLSPDEQDDFLYLVGYYMNSDSNLDEIAHIGLGDNIQVNNQR